MPTRGNMEKIGVRTDANPESTPRQNGELADSASSTGRSARRPSSAWTAVAASGIRTWTWNAIVGTQTEPSPQGAVQRAPQERQLRGGVRNARVRAGLELDDAGVGLRRSARRR